MPTRRQEKIARVIRESVSDTIANHLNDPRIKAFVSVTRVEVSADLRIANLYLSMFGGTKAEQDNTFAAIMHARRRIQMLLGKAMSSKFCPTLNIHRDDKFKKALETMQLLDDLARELSDKDSVDQQPH